MLNEGEDFYLNEDGNMVFTAAYHLKRGYCCKNGCKHCPWNYQENKGARTVKINKQNITLEKIYLMDIEKEIQQLIEDMNASIQQADSFIQGLGE